MKNLKRLWTYFCKYKLLLIIAVITSSAVAGTDAAVAYIVKDIMDGIFINKDTELLRMIPLVIIALFLIRFGCRFLQSYTVQYAGEKSIEKIRNEMFSKVVRLPMQYFHENNIGIIMTKIINDVAMLQSAVSAMMRIFRSALSIVFLFAVIFKQNIQLAAMILLLIPIITFIIMKSGKKIKKTSRKIQEQTGFMGNALNESFTGIRVVKSFNTEAREVKRFSSVAMKELKYKLRQAMVASISAPLLETLAGLSVAGIIAYGGSMVISGETTTGTFFSFITAFGLMFEPIKKINGYNRVIQVANASAERIFEVLDQENNIVGNNGTIICDAKGADVTFENVSFSYGKGSQQVLKDLSITVPYGTTVALVGPSGAGKSTFVSLIPRFYDVKAGSIKIGGTDIRDFDVHSLRREIAIVSQSPFLFNNTIRYNLTYGCGDDITEEEMIQAAEKAYALDFINALPNGFDTLIGERGTKLSGGQKQRLTIARAILSDPQILILDEATSALDTESEKIVQSAMDNLIKNRTCFTIAHRLSTVIDADVIAVIENGRVTEMGTHTELLESSNTYKKLYEMQFNV
jgi:subfamily B ATP-binding cassette protein MsbA